MSKTIALLGVIALTAACSNTQPKVQVVEDRNQYAEPVYWNGPGWYWGVYINNEDEFWNHYDQHYPNRNAGDHGGSGQGGGNHGGGHAGGGHK